MKRIILMRHGKVAIDDTETVDAVSLKKWIEAYDAAPLARDVPPPKESLLTAKESDVVVCSTLRRSADSATLLHVTCKEKNPLFDEIRIPKIAIPLLRLKVKHWLVLSRVMMLLGLTKKEDSLKSVAKQAASAAQRLTALSQQCDSVLLVGHGAMNWMIGKALLRQGWHKKTRSAHSHWGMTLFEHPSG